MRCLTVLSFLLFIGMGTHAQTAEANGASAAAAAEPMLDFDLGSLPPAPKTIPQLNSQPLKSSDSLLPGVNLGGGSKLQFEGDRKPSESRVGAETFEPGVLVQSQKSHQIGPTFFGLSIKKSLQ
jgi:hypothetical protein